MLKFKNYYYKYLGIYKSQSKKIILTKNRSIVINNLYQYPLIITKLNNNLLISISPKHKKYLLHSNFILSKNINLIFLYKILKKGLKEVNSSIDLMRIYTFENIEYIFDMNLVNTLNLKEKEKEKYFTIFKNKNFNKIILEKLWNRNIKNVLEKRFFYIEKNNEIVSYSYISDINFNGGNIIVYTKPKWRNMGFGKKVAQASVKWCIDNNILPIYRVSEKNNISIHIAKKIGLSYKKNEIVFKLKIISKLRE
ncbi:GNAT family N-acetyltransferase [Marinitoga lauensis]|uniref:GNAT family N-acetyltransferase n=1 Tax=Marinitoga lauensis TaxID=2201189 RepID=UPI00101375A2|nr:GNAT family N-acetyltransferase [Marinitoga lauensis]